MNILFINCCIRGQKSRTLRIARTFIEELQKKDDIEIKEVNLQHQRLYPLTSQFLDVRERLIEEKVYTDSMFSYAKQFAKADKIIIAAPFWENSFPALLKIYFENISVMGITISHDPKAEPFVTAQKLLFICTAGANIVGCDHGGTQIESLCKMWKIKEYSNIYAENLDIKNADAEKIVLEAEAKAIALAKNW